MRREAYYDGTLMACISSSIMEREQFIGHKDLPFYINVGRWSVGRVRGDIQAIPEKYRADIEQLRKEQDK